MLELVLPGLRYERSYLATEQERAVDEEKIPITSEGFPGMLDALVGLRDGTNVPAGMAQTLELWLVDGDEYLGKVQVRANPDPLQGHIGIAIRPSRRRQGLALQAAELARPHVAALGLTEIIATCGPDNAPCRALIERFGGTLVERAAMLRYVIRCAARLFEERIGR